MSINSQDNNQDIVNKTFTHIYKQYFRNRVCLQNLVHGWLKWKQKKTEWKIHF